MCMCGKGMAGVALGVRNSFEAKHSVGYVLLRITT